MTVAILFSSLSGLVANAMDLSQKYEVSWDHTLTDRAGNTFTWYGGIASSSNIFACSNALSTRG